MPAADIVLVIPGTSLVGLEVLSSLAPLPGLTVHGAGMDVAAGESAGYAKYDFLPHVHAPEFASALRDLVRRDAVRYVYPANELALGALAAADLGDVLLVAHPAETLAIAGSKRATHDRLADLGIMPSRYTTTPPDAAFPVFAKPDISHSSIGAQAVADAEALAALETADVDFWQTHLVTERLIADEVTVDCFSTQSQGLLYAGGRTRDVTENGVSVVTTHYPDPDLEALAQKINGRLTFNGAWFFQAKRAPDGRFRVMEVGARIAGASGIRRAQGVNLPQLSVLAASGATLGVYLSRFRFTARRGADGTVVEADESFGALYVDLDDTLILNGRLNAPVLDLVRSVRAARVPVAIITRHALDPVRTLQQHGILDLFDEVFHARSGEPKATFIGATPNSVLIDDSFSERVATLSNPNVLAVDASAAPLIRKLFHRAP